MTTQTSKLKTNIIFFVMFVLLVFIDRITKIFSVNTLKEKPDIDIIKGFLQLHYLENRGAAWGMFQGARVIFIIITAIIVIISIVYLIKSDYTKGNLLLRIAIILLISGAIGNLIDRVLYTYVVDFIYVSAINFPVFNVADCYVCIAAALIIIYSLKSEDKAKDKGKEEEHA